ncbi:MAG: hypothetical protein LCH90_24545, partial [Proteobacteria bacterium]|nr:hypothetical protein [Pseudomonadota bacterium]
MVAAPGSFSGDEVKGASGASAQTVLAGIERLGAFSQAREVSGNRLDLCFAQVGRNMLHQAVGVVPACGGDGRHGLSLPAGHKALLCPQFLALLSQKINGREPKCLRHALASRPCTEEYFTILSKTPAVLLNFASRDSFTARMHNFTLFFAPDQSPIDTVIFGIPSELKGINIQEFVGHCLTTESCPSHWVNCALHALEESIPDFDTAFKFLELTLKHCMKHDASLINLGFIRCIS